MEDRVTFDVWVADPSKLAQDQLVDLVLSHNAQTQEVDARRRAFRARAGKSPFLLAKDVGWSVVMQRTSSPRRS